MYKYLIAILAPIVVAVSWFFSYAYGLLSLLVMLLLALLMARPESYFILFVLFRPLADLIARLNFGVGNLATILSVILFFICGVLILRTRKQGGAFIRTFNGLSAIMLFVTLFSFVFTGSVVDSFSDYFRMLVTIVAVNYVAKYYDAEKSRQSLCYLIFFSSILPLTFGLYQILFHKGMWIDGFYRVYSTFTHPNVFAEYLFVIFFVGVYLLHDRSAGKSTRSLVYLLCSLVLFELFHTYTRNVWVAFGLGGLFYILVGTDFASKLKYLFIGSAGLLLLWGGLVHRFDDILHPRDYATQDSWTWRLNLWGKVIDQLKEHPFFGNGLGMFQVNFGVPAHNDYLRMAYEVGYLGLLSFLAVFIVILVFALKKMRLAEETEKVKYKIAASLIIGILVIELADNLIRSLVVIFYFWILMALFLMDSPVGEKYADPVRQ